MALDVTTEVIIERPPGEVAAYAGDPSNAPDWYVNIASFHWRTPPPLAIGSKLDFVARFLGRRLAYTYEILDLVPGQRLAMRTAQGLPDGDHLHPATVRRAPTRMTLRDRGEPAGFAKIASPAMATAIPRANQKDLANLKRSSKAATDPADRRPAIDCGSTLPATDADAPRPVAGSPLEVAS